MESVSNPSKKLTVLYLRFFYLFWVVIGMLSLLIIPSQIIVDGDAAQTVSNLTANETLFRLSIAGGLVTQLFQITVVVLLFRLFVSVNRSVSMLLLIIALVGVPISMVSYVFSFTALDFALGAEYLSGFSPEQLENFTMKFLEFHEYGIAIASIFWGLWLFPIGYLANKSNYFPKFVGYALYIGGIGYLLHSFASYLVPDENGILSLFELMSFGEMVFIFWLVVMGAKVSNEERI